MIGFKTEAISKDEILRVAYNWRTQPGVRTASTFLAPLGMALKHANPEEAAKIKEAFSTEWETWNDEFDPKTGRPILDLEEEEDYPEDEDGRYRQENDFDQRDHYTEM